MSSKNYITNRELILIMKIQILNSILKKNHNFFQVGKSHSEFDIKNRKADITNFIVANDDTNGVTRLVNNAFA